MLGQLLLKWFAIDASVLQNIDKLFSVPTFRLELLQVPIAQSYAVKLLCLGRGDTGLAQGLDEAGCAGKTPLLLDPQISLVPG